MNYFEAEIKPLLKKVHNFTVDNVAWVQYDIKALNSKQLNKLVKHLMTHYGHVYPCLQRVGDVIVGHIQFEDRIPF